MVMAMNRTRPTRTTRTSDTSSRGARPDRPQSTGHPTSIFEPELWHLPATGVSVIQDGVFAEHFCVPEGIVGVIRCRHCGGRDEQLTEYPHAVSEEDAVVHGRESARRHGDFMARHDQCAIKPRVYRPLATVRAFSEYLIAEATEILRMGDCVQQAVYLMYENGMADFDYPPSTHHAGNEAAHRTAVAELHWDVRRFIREHALSVQAIAHLGTCWVSADPLATDGTLGAMAAPDRAEALAVTVVTPTDGRLLYLPIAPVADDRLAALLRVPHWRVLSEAAPMTDGLLAVPGGR